MKYFSTFSGIGGFELGIESAYENFSTQKKEKRVGEEDAEALRSQEGEPYHERNQGLGNSGAGLFQHLDGSSIRQPTCVGYSEIDKYATQIYQKHFPTHTNYGDITQLRWEEVPDFDLLVGGFPCQAFSIAGKRKGFEDTRGTLFFDIAKGLQIKQPSFVVLENVKGLISHDKGNTLETILLSLQELGYYANIEVYNSKEHGVPQNRERIIFICRHLKTLMQTGNSLNLNISKQIISEYLFQILLNNLAEAKKLQEIKSKDWVIGYLLSKEINENLLNHDTNDNTKDGISIPTAENKYQLKGEEVWQNIAIWLNNEWEDDSPEKNKSTTLTAINEIIAQKTYTFFQMQRAILLATVLLKNYYPNLWNEILSDLIVIKENTKYARINDKKEEVIISETGNAYLTEDIQENEQFIAFANLRGTPRPQVFPFSGTDTEDTRNTREDLSYAIDANYHKGTNTLAKGRRQLIQLNTPTHSNDRVYGAEGISPTLNTMQGSNRQPFITEKDLMIRDGRDNRSCLRAGRTPELGVKGMSIRRLTPNECERLQGFPDGWTEGVSDTQRYNCLGNAVTVNVIRDIFLRML